MNTAISMIGQTMATDGQFKTPAVTKGKKAYSGNPTEAVLSNFPNSAAEAAETLSQNIADTKNSVEKVLKTSDVVPLPLSLCIIYLPPIDSWMLLDSI